MTDSHTTKIMYLIQSSVSGQLPSEAYSLDEVIAAVNADVHYLESIGMVIERVGDVRHMPIHGGKQNDMQLVQSVRIDNTAYLQFDVELLDIFYTARAYTMAGNDIPLNAGAELTPSTVLFGEEDISLPF